MDDGDDDDEDPSSLHNDNDDDDDDNDDGEGSALTTAAVGAPAGAPATDTALAEVPTPAAAGTESSTTSADADRAAEICTGAGAAGECDDGDGGGDDHDVDDGRMAVRILDVRGQFYPLRVRPETTVGELKLMLVDATGVELARQRIIYGGKVRCGAVWCAHDAVGVKVQADILALILCNPLYCCAAVVYKALSLPYVHSRSSR